MYQSEALQPARRPSVPERRGRSGMTSGVGVVLVGMLFVVGSGCAMNRAEQGAVIGAGTGGVAGAVIGHATGSTARGAIIGAAVGGVAGAVIGHQMDRQAEELSIEIPGATVTRVGEGIVVTFPDGLLFGFDSDKLVSAARGNLSKVATSLGAYPETRILIVGHTDAQGSDTYNMGLSERRANSAAEFLVGEGIERSRTNTAGRGEVEPIASNETDEGRQQNRRVEIAIYNAGQ